MSYELKALITLLHGGTRLVPPSMPSDDLMLCAKPKAYGWGGEPSYLAATFSRVHSTGPYGI